MFNCYLKKYSSVSYVTFKYCLFFFLYFRSYLIFLKIFLKITLNDFYKSMTWDFFGFSFALILNFIRLNMIQKKLVIPIVGIVSNL